MKQTAQKQQQAAPTEYRATARIVDGSLILSLPDAMNPIVWRLELGSVKASAMEVKKKDGSRHLLVLKTPRGDSYEIALFESREKAVYALMQISSAFQAGERQGLMRAAPMPANQQAAFAPAYAPAPVRAAAPRAPGTGLKWLAAFAAVILAIALFTYLGSAPAPRLEEALPGESTATTTGGDANAESGVPQSADHMLRGF